MARLAAIFIGLCMGLIAGSVGAVLYLYFGMTGAESAIVALAAFTGLAVYNTISSRLRDRVDLGGQIADLSRGTADLARQVLELGRRVAAVEAKADKVLTQAAEAHRPLAAEIDELGALVNQIAASVAIHDATLRKGESAWSTHLAPSPAPPPARPAPPAPPPVVATPVVAAPAAAPAVAVPIASPSAAAPAVSALSAPEGASGSTESEGPVSAPGVAAGLFQGMSREVVIALVREAVEANRIELHLQPIVMLPQRKVRYYEALARLRTRDGEMIMPADFLGPAETGGLMARIDNAMLFRCVQAVRRLLGKNRDVGVFCNIAPETLADPEFFPQFTELADANRALAPALVFELAQPAYRAMGPIENESLAALADRGFRFSLDHVGDLRFEPRDLADRGFRFVKVPATQLLNRTAPAAADIHPADLAGLLARFGIDLIAETIERESTVVDLLDYDVKFGQGFLFAPPRPVRPEVLQGIDRSLIAAELSLPEKETASAKTDAARAGKAAARPGLSEPGSALAQLARGMIARK